MGASFHGLPVFLNEGMMRTAWFIRDADDRVLSCGTIGMGVLETPGADAKAAAKIECGGSVYALLLAPPPPQGEMTVAEKLTKAQAKALSCWKARETSIYHAGGVRRDVGKKLNEMGLIEPVEKGFHPSYSICRLTPAGRHALENTDGR